MFIPSKFFRAVAVVVVMIGLATGIPSAQATPFIITSQLTGDTRTGNPGNLIVDVTITGGDTSNVVMWLIDINSPSHPDIKLKEFDFNIAGDPLDYSFSNFNPATWTVNSPGSATGAGGGGAKFTFESVSTSSADDVTNSQDLTFDMTKDGGGLFAVSDFLGADTFTGAAGSGQLGAHLQSLTVDITTCPQFDCSDSGFALGYYFYLNGDPPGGDTGPLGVPEPATLVIFGLGLAGLGFARRKWAV